MKECDAMFNKPSPSSEELMIAAQGDSEVREARVIKPKARPHTVNAVYFIAAVGTPFVKIGTVRDESSVAARMEALQSGCPHVLQHLFTLTPAGRSEESRLHKRFREYHYRAEWFRCDGALKEFLQYAIAFPDEASRKMLASLSC